MALKHVVALAAIAAIPLGLAGCSSSDGGTGSPGKADKGASTVQHNGGGKKANDSNVQLPAGGHGNKGSFCKLFVKGDNVLVNVQKSGGQLTPEQAKQELGKVVSAAPAEI